jgi:iron complex outermembrane receptor protein
MMTETLRWATGIFMTVLLGLSNIQPAQAQTKDFNVPAQSATTGIPEFARQAGIQILVSEPLVRGKRITAVTGPYTVEEALKMLLKGTGLIATSKDGATYTLAVPQAPNLLNSTGSAGSTSSAAEVQSGAAIRVAANDERSAGGLTEIVVTAQKREERLQDVPVPVTVISAQTLLANNQLRIQDFSTSVPGLTVTPQASFSYQSLAIRGITTGVGSNPSVGVVVDDVPYGSSTSVGGGGGTPVPDIDPNDLAQVEVLRGPQGTLYGASSLGGLMKFVTVDPSTDGFSGRVEAGTSGVYHGAELGYNFRAAVNVPLSETWALRASAFTREDPGYIDNVETGQTGVNKTDVSGGRVSALWKPSENLSLHLSALFQEYKGDGFSDVDQSINGFVGPVLGNLQQYYLRGTGAFDRKVQAYSATLKAKLGSADLTAISGFNINQYSDSYDTTYFFGPFTQFGGPGTSFNGFGVPGTAAPENNKTDKFSQEVRLSMPIGSQVDWLFGSFYTHEASHYVQSLNAEDAATGAIVGQDLNINFAPTFAEYAAFTDLTFHVTDRFDVQLGGRESHIRQTYSEVDSGPIVPYFYGVPSPHVIPPLDANANAFTYLVTPEFKVSSDLMVYARLASGYRAGGVNIAAGAAGVPIQYQPDKTQNYEIGIKGDFIDHRLSIDASLYRINWKNIQFFEIANGFGFTTNGSAAKSQGIELSVQARPVTGLTIGGWVAWDDAVLTQAFPTGSTAYGVAGDRLPYSSRFSGNLSVDQEFPLWREVTGFVGSSVSYVGDRVGEFSGAPPPPGRQDLPAYARTDVRAGAKYDSWTINLFVNNVADQRGLLSGGINTSPAFAFIYIQPRTAGLSVAKTF